ncbi:OLC1v1027086C1 [Oldenlandia corymbosa var. corymbosa]|uniref:OLC1v1027086C1 n=1 Tax=Oldenlandia corymbosa var. corymbosa TaxID=529605 RepID=A0AAV1CAV5_OLDCO|nr:OLC1v1027086C1 [Oldenlandia corymbosa var. corymbosa]
MEAKNDSPGPFPMGETPQEKGGFDHVPKSYYVPPLNRPSLTTESTGHDIPVIDLDGLTNNPARRSPIIEDISKACKDVGFFQIVNHGISQRVLDDALSAAFKFFNLSNKEKSKFMSNDVHNPVRYGTGIKDGLDKIQNWRTFLKHYANPLDQYISLWPETPQEYREKMSEYSKAVHKLGVSLMEAITESLGLGPAYMSAKMEEGSQTIVVNCYPPCPQPDLALGFSPHSDYSCVTIVLQSSSGLQIQDPSDGKWSDVPNIHGALQVNVGDCVEVLSNGMYKSVIHKVKLSSDTTRVSIASLHSLALNEKMETAPELVNEQNPKGYRESSFEELLDFISKNDITDGKFFIDTLRLKRND